MRTLLSVGIVVFLCAMSLGSLHLNNVSLDQARRLSVAEKRYRVLEEKRDSLVAEVVLLSGFARMESLWTASGRRLCEPAAVAQAGEAVDRAEVVAREEEDRQGSRSSMGVAATRAEELGVVVAEAGTKARGR